MDKGRRDAKSCGAIRYKHSKRKLSSGVLSSSEAKREKKVRKLSSVVGRSSLSNEDCEMESLGAIKDEDELPSFVGKNTNISKRKFFDDCNGVGHASVPRRLRSAMTKRCRDSTSPPLPHPKKVKPHVRDGKKSTMKKPKSNMKQGRSERCSKGVLPGPITKDEEEVAETLFALAGLFADKPKGNAELLDHNPLQVPVSNDSPPAIQVSEKLRISAHSSIATDAVVASLAAERLSENLKAESWNQPNLAYSKKLHLSPNDSSSAKIKDQRDEKALHRSSAEFSDRSDQLSDFRSRHALQKNSSFPERKPEMLSGMATPIGCQLELHQKLESKKSGMALWPGSPSTNFPKAPQADDQPLPSSASKLPAWLDAACSESRRTSAQNNSIAKVRKVPADRRLSKRCAMHVRVCHLIQALRTSDSEERLSPHLHSQMRAHEGLNRVVSSTTNGFNGYGISVTPIVSATNVHPKSNLSEIGTLNQTNNRDRPQSPAASEVSSWQKQNFDMFMSLSRDSSGKFRHGGSDSNPYLASLGQHQFGASFSLHQPCYNSSSDHFPTLQQVQMQLQSHIKPLYSAQGGPQGTMKHHIRHQQEFSEYYNREERPMIQFLSLQSGSPTSPQPHQHQFPMTVASLPFSAGKVDRGGGFRTNAPLALQLLCTDRR